MWYAWGGSIDSTLHPSVKDMFDRAVACANDPSSTPDLTATPPGPFCSKLFVGSTSEIRMIVCGVRIAMASDFKVGSCVCRARSL